jgi:hypothetical protein
MSLDFSKVTALTAKISDVAETIASATDVWLDLLVQGSNSTVTKAKALLNLHQRNFKQLSEELQAEVEKVNDEIESQKSWEECVRQGFAENDDEVDEEDSWEQVYSRSRFSEESLPKDSPFVDTTLWLTYGGGPSGGYVRAEDGTNDVYHAHKKGAFDPWTFTLLPGKNLSFAYGTGSLAKKLDEGRLKVRLIDATTAEAEGSAGDAP